ncbi:LPXTG cell wall anchor domain-containing protein [Streptomyces sp. A3M-1-3]|uniref:SCO1860 family LAETG-anchored protein n=1 Tax=Streptomyces sp. A3M-1-3 TaxID=2962044 RepID=UPI0020B7D4DA|nr:SCO1860 family LAETG-anchored protein [Streptomyces sp. A3M-1-3]MCP3821305.1 LPXTG cell wall anchor domain-containing protein [Streptomyces sp. A3M-1-3]
MNSNTFRMPARRCASAVAAATLAAGPAALLTASPAHATDGGGTGGDGRASAVVLRTGLDVSLLNKTVHVPLKATLNEVHAPASAGKTALTVTLDGVDQGRPFTVLRADVATAKATADGHRAEGYTNLAKARVHVPGLPLLSLIEVEKVTSKAVCEAGKQPVAESNVLGAVTVLGKRTTLTTGGTTKVGVPGVGEVRLDLSKTETTSSTAAATALRLNVSLNPLKLNVAEVEGEITLAEATCAAPKAPAQAPAEQAPAEQEPSGVEAQSGGTEPEPAEESLAKTGGSSTTPYVAGGAIALVAAGAAALVLARGRSRT